MAVEKIISGGQTEVDRGALDAALREGFPCGGWCPPGRAAEDGHIPITYPVTELAEGGYRQRTLRNVLDSDGTAIIYFGILEGGTEQTLQFCIKHHKPYKLLDAEEISSERASTLLHSFCKMYGIRILNVAGPRLSRQPRSALYTEEAIVGLLKKQLASEIKP